MRLNRRVFLPLYTSSTTSYIVWYFQTTSLDYLAASFDNCMYDDD